MLCWILMSCKKIGPCSYFNFYFCQASGKSAPPCLKVLLRKVQVVCVKRATADCLQFPEWLSCNVMSDTEYIYRLLGLGTSPSPLNPQTPPTFAGIESSGSWRRHHTTCRQEMARDLRGIMVNGGMTIGLTDPLAREKENV